MRERKRRERRGRRINARDCKITSGTKSITALSQYITFVEVGTAPLKSKYVAEQGPCILFIKKSTRTIEHMPSEINSTIFFVIWSMNFLSASRFVQRLFCGL